MATSLAHYFGGFFLATCFSFILYGMTTIQTHVYLWRSKSDSKYLYWLMLYEYLIDGFGSEGTLYEIKWTAGATIIMTIIIVSMVHGIFIHRIWLLSDRWIPAILLPSLLLLLNVVIESFACHYYFTYKTWPEITKSKRASTLDETLAAVVVANDVIVTATLIYYLRRSAGRGMQKTNRWIIRLQMYVVNSGAISAAAALSVLVTYLLIPDSLLYFGLYQTLCKLYDNALLALLNARPSKDAQLGYIASFEGSSNSYELTSRKSIFHRNIQVPPTAFEIQREVVIENDLNGMTMEIMQESVKTPCVV